MYSNTINYGSNKDISSTTPIVNEKDKKYNTPREDWKDWRKTLYEKGWVVVPSVVPKERVEQYRNQFWDWLESLGSGILRNDKSTWTNDRWPDNAQGIFLSYAFGQNQFCWDIRSEQGIIDVFSELYNHDPLLVSFDGGNCSRPKSDNDQKTPWWHFDQAYNKFGFHCIQGLFNMEECGPHDGGLIVYEGSHLQHHNYFKETGAVSEGDWYMFESDPRQLKFFKDCKEIKVCAGPGDLVLWDSRTMHYAIPPSLEQGNGKCRMVTYVSYQPASLATPIDISSKQYAFNHKQMTTHWASESVTMTTSEFEGKTDRKFNYDPTTLPTLSEKAKKLAGLIPY
eukprot:gene10776-13196_t